MNYYESDDNKGKKIGIIAVAVYAVLCVGLMFITFTIASPEVQSGILVDFGNTDKAGGTTDLALSELDVNPASPKRQTTQEDQIMVTEQEDAPAVVKPPDRETPKPIEEQETAKPREVDRRALFPGRTEGSTSTSQGDSEGEGNQGSEQGGPDGSHSEGGSGTSGTSFDLSGRYMVGQFPRPAYNSNEQGRVVIQITVDREGRVTSAAFRQEGSTTNDGQLVKSAREAAMRARFTPSENDIQTGTITYIFRLN